MISASSCGPTPREREQESERQGVELQLLRTIKKGHLCDPSAIAQTLARNYPGIDPVSARQEVDRLLYTQGCGTSDSRPSEPAETEPVQPTTATTVDEVPLKRHGNEYIVPVRVNEVITLPFVLDTGATDLVIPEDVALTLVRSGALTSEDFLGNKSYIMANGSHQSAE